jgi:hypothetical protein
VALAQRKLGNYRSATIAFQKYLNLTPGAPDRAAIEAWVRKHSA